MTRSNSGQPDNQLHVLWQTFPLAWRLFRDRQVAPLLKVIPILGLIYVLVPVDLLPDVIPIGGQIDDIALLLIALRVFIKLSPPDLVARHSQDFDGVTSEEDDSNVVDGEWRAVDSSYRER